MAVAEAKFQDTESAVVSTPEQNWPPGRAEVMPREDGMTLRLDAVYVLNNLGVGGSETKTVRVVNALIERGLKVGLVYLNSPDTLRSTVSSAATVWALDRRGKFSLRTLWRLRRILAAAKPRALISVNLYATLYAVLAKWLLPISHAQTVCLINTSGAGGSMPAWRRWLYKWLLHRVDHSMHGCEAYRAQWLPAHDAAWRRSGVIYNGVDLEQFDSIAFAASQEHWRTSHGIDTHAFVIGTVGRLTVQKNQSALLDTLSRLRRSGVNAHLIIAGDGPQRGPLGEKAVRLGVREHVTFTGELSDVRSALAAMDVFVLPSVGVETFSNAALEAMAMARPVILTNIGGAAEMLKSGVEGFVIPPCELAARLPAMLSQLHADPARRLSMGAAARRRVEECFSLTAMLDAHLQLIQISEAERAHV